MRRLGLLLVVAACRETPPVESPPPLAIGAIDASADRTPPAPDAGTPAPRLPAALAHLTQPDETRVLLGPFAWPPRGTSAFVGQLSVAFVWKNDRAEDHDTLPTDRTPTRAVVKDVNGDGAPELVVFLAPLARSLEAFEDRSTVWIFGVRPEDGRVARMHPLEYQVMGAADERTLDAELASLGKLGPTSGVPVERVVTRLPWATADELRALVPSQGLRVCHRQALRRSCNTVTRASIDAKSVKKLIEKPGRFATYVNEDMRDLQAPSCEAKPGRKSATVTFTVTCSASVGGPEGGQWIFEQRGPDLELVEIGTWAESS